MTAAPKTRAVRIPINSWQLLLWPKSRNSKTQRHNPAETTVSAPAMELYLTRSTLTLTLAFPQYCARVFPPSLLLTTWEMQMARRRSYQVLDKHSCTCREEQTKAWSKPIREKTLPESGYLIDTDLVDIL